MATATLLPPLFNGDPILADPDPLGTIGWNTGATPSFTVVGGADAGGALRVPSDGYTDDAILGAAPSPNGYFRFEDTGLIPLTATINSVQLVAEVSATTMQLFNDGATGFNGFMLINPPYLGLTFEPVLIPDWNTVPASNPPFFTGSSTYMSAVMPVVPGTGVPWAYADLYGDPTVLGSGWNAAGWPPFFNNWLNGRGWWFFLATPSGAPGDALSIDYLALIVDYTAGGGTNVSITGTGGVEAAGRVQTIGTQRRYLPAIAPALSGIGLPASPPGTTPSLGGFGGSGSGGVYITPGGSLVRPGGAPPELLGIQWGLMRFDVRPRPEDAT